MEEAFQKKDKKGVLERLEVRFSEIECEDALHRACGNGWVDVAEIIIRSYYIDPDTAEVFGSKLRPIHIAAREGQTEAIDFLILSGGNKEAEDLHGNTAMHFAFLYKRWDTAEYLITKAMCNPGKKNLHGVTPLVVGLENAIDCEDPHVMQRIVHLYASAECSAVTIPYWVLEKMWVEHQNEEIVRLTKSETTKNSQCGHAYVPIPVTVAGEGNIKFWQFLVKNADVDLSTADTNGNNALLAALQNGHTEMARIIIASAPNLVTVKNIKGESPARFAVRNNLMDIVKCLVDNGADPDEPDKDGNTPLASALRERHQLVVEYLVRDLKCDLVRKNKYGRTPFTDELTSALYENNADRCMWLLTLTLETVEKGKSILAVPKDALYLACKNHMIAVVEMLLQWYSCDPLQPIQSIGGQSVMHKAFERQDIEIASILLAHKPCRSDFSLQNGKTLLQLAEGNKDLISLLEQSSDQFVCQARKPVKVFILGNPLNGATSLVKALRGCMDHEPLLGSLRTVHRPRHRTVGLSPYKVHHKDFGSIILYDCAGRTHYRPSLAAILEKLVERLPAVFVIVIDIDQKKEAVVQELLYWTYFINCVTGKSPGKSHVIVAGSKADSSTMNPWGFQNCCTSWINEDINDLIFGGGVMLDCRKLQSRGLSDLTSILSQSCASIRSEYPFKVQFEHLSLYAFCVDEMSSGAFTVAQLKGTIFSHHSNNSLLPQGDDSLSKSLKLLHDKGLLVYLESDGDLDEGYVVVDLRFLLRRVVGQLFASSGDKQHLPLNVDTGLIPLAHFEQLPCTPEMISLFLHHFSLGTEIPQLGAIFVPDLVKKDTSGLNNLATRNNGYWFGMLSEFKHEHPQLHYIDRYLHVLQMEVMEMYVKAEIVAASVLTADATFTVWKRGIHWVDSNQVECLMELSEDGKTFLFLMACPQGEEIHLVVCRSRLLNKLREMRERYFKACSSNIVDNLVPSSDLSQYPNLSSENVCKATLSNVRDAVLKREGLVEFKAVAVVGKHSTNVAVDVNLHELLHFDSFFDIPLKSLADLIHLQSIKPNEAIPTSLAKEFAVIIAKMAGTDPSVLRLCGLVVKDDELASIISNETETEVAELVADKLVEKWIADQLTPSQLRAIVDQFTLFAPLDSELMKESTLL